MAKDYDCQSFGLDGVFVVQGRKRKRLEPRFDLARAWQEGFGWGRYLPPGCEHLSEIMPLSKRPLHPGAKQLAVAILADYFNPVVAGEIYNMFAYRAFENRQGAFVLKSGEIETIVAAIRQTADDPSVKIAKQRAAREAPIPVTDTDASVVWDAYEEPRVNKPERKGH